MGIKPAAKGAKAAPTTVTQKHLAADIAAAHELSKKQGEAIMSDVIALLVKNLKKGARIRLAYLANFTSPNERAICLAESDDGLSFRSLGLAVDLRAAGTITDPSVVQLPNGSWLMALSAGQTTRLARSTDGLSFTLGETLTYGGVPELALTGDGGVRLYVCAGAIVAYRSQDAVTWQREQPVVTRGPNGSMLVCDPSRVAGTDVFVFKTGM